MSCRPCLRRVKATAMQAAMAATPTTKLSPTIVLKRPGIQSGQQRMIAVSGEMRAPSSPVTRSRNIPLPRVAWAGTALQQCRVDPQGNAEDHGAKRGQRIAHHLQLRAAGLGRVGGGRHQLGPQVETDDVDGDEDDDRIDDPRRHAPPESAGDDARRRGLRRFVAHVPVTLEGPPASGGPSPSIRDPQIASPPSAAGPIAGGDPAHDDRRSRFMIVRHWITSFRC